MEKVGKRENAPQPEFEIRREKSLEFISHSIKDYEDCGDEEAVFMLALTLDHPEWEQDILKQIQKHKPHVQKAKEILEKLKRNYSEWQPEGQPVIEDAGWWAEHLPEKREQVANLIAYFNPSPEEVAKRIIVVPSDSLLPSKETGRSFHIGETVVIMSHTQNPDNFEHEFLHSVINPLTEKLAELIPEEKVIALASHVLKNKKEEDYGDNALSLLNEELIRTYNLIQTGESIKTFDDFARQVNLLDEEGFNRIVEMESRFQSRLKAMGISSFAEFKQRLKEYYDKYEKNELRELVYKLYQKFEVEKSKNPKIRFGDFFKKEAEKMFS